MEAETMANPEVEENMPSQEAVNESIFGSDGNFFADLDREVNGSILDPIDEPIDVSETQSPAPPVNVEAGNTDPVETVNYEKRYKDSSREAQKMKQQLDEVEPFMPLLQLMNEDEGLVDTVKQYLVDGKKPPQFEVPEDFEFDIQEAMNDQNSDSAKYFSTLMDNTVSQKVNNIIGEERVRDEQEQSKAHMAQQANQFKERMKMNDGDFEEMMNWANDHKMSFDDLYYMKNRDKINQNVSNSTRKDMLNQMNAVRDIPASQSNMNSVKVEEDPNKAVLDALKGLDGSVDNIFSD